MGSSNALLSNIPEQIVADEVAEEIFRDQKINRFLSLHPDTEIRLKTFTFPQIKRYSVSGDHLHTIDNAKFTIHYYDQPNTDDRAEVKFLFDVTSNGSACCKFLRSEEEAERLCEKRKERAKNSKIIHGPVDCNS